MADLPIIEATQPQSIGDAWVSTVVISDGEEELDLRVEVSDSQRCIADLVEPTREWMVQRTWACAPLLDNYRPVLEQVREWAQPLRLRAEPR